MVDRSWLGLAIRVVGLLIVGNSIAVVGESWSSAFQWIQYVATSAPGNTESLIGAIAYAIASMIQLLFGIVLMLSGGALARRWLKTLDNRCPACLYDIAGLTAEVCPECGGPIRRKTATETK